MAAVGSAALHLISIHSLRVEGDHMGDGVVQIHGISIHSLRVEGDVDYPAVSNFCASISIHSLRVEGDVLGCIIKV